MPAHGGGEVMQESRYQKDLSDIPDPSDVLPSLQEKIMPGAFRNVQREGPDYRGGRDISPAQYRSIFGFREIQFGKTLSGREKQCCLNFSSDALMDLVNVLKLSPKEMSFGGELSIAFAACGQGHALAHYEESGKRINLTRVNGAGSLGYVWMHALDHITGKRLGFTGRLTDHLLANDSDRLPASFRTVMNAIKFRPIPEGEKNNYVEQYVREISSGFRENLLKMTHKWDHPVLEKKRHELIDDIIRQAADSEKVISFQPSGSCRPDHYKASNQAFKALDEFQAGYGDGRIGTMENLIWVNAESESIRRKVRDFKNHILIPSYGEYTRYYQQSRMMEAAASRNGYQHWSSGGEIFSRAAAAFLADMCREAGIRNDYLNAGTDRKLMLSEGRVLALSPDGEERSRMDLAFSQLFQELSRKKTLMPVYNEKISAELFSEKKEEEAAQIMNERTIEKQAGPGSLDQVIACAKAGSQAVRKIAENRRTAMELTAER